MTAQGSMEYRERKRKRIFYFNLPLRAPMRYSAHGTPHHHPYYAAPAVEVHHQRKMKPFAEELLEEAMSLGSRMESKKGPTVAPERPRTLGPLMKSDAPRIELQNEKAWHRTAAYLVAQGWTSRKIAEATGKSEQQISLLTRQPWFNEHVAAIIDQAGLLDEGAINMLRGASASFASTIITLASTAKSESVRLSAATTALDRIFGRPVQTLQNLTSGKKAVPLDAADEIRETEAEIERLLKITEHSRQ